MKKEYWILSANTALFVVLALITLWFEPTISRDGVLYIKLADIWRQTGNFSTVVEQLGEHRIPPLFLYLMKLLMNIGFSGNTSGIVLNLFSGACLPFLVYLIVQEIQDDKRISLASSLLIALNPTVISLAVEVQRDMIYLLFVGLFIFFFLRVIKSGHVYDWVICGIISAVSFLCRHESIEFLFIAVLYLISSLIFEREKYRKKILCAIVFFMIFCITTFALIFYMGVEKYCFSKYYLSRYPGVNHIIGLFINA